MALGDKTFAVDRLGDVWAIWHITMFGREMAQVQCVSDPEAETWEFQQRGPFRILRSTDTELDPTETLEASRKRSS